MHIFSGSRDSLTTRRLPRLIPLSKNPAVRPIGISETLRRIIGKSILRVLGREIEEVADCAQHFKGQRSGCKVSVHTIDQLLQNDEVEDVLIVMLAMRLIKARG